MALSDILKKITEEARAQAQLLITKAESEVKAIQSETATAEERLKAEWSTKEKDALASLVKSSAALKSSQKSQVTDEAQTSVLDQTLTAFVEKLSSGTGVEEICGKLLKSLPDVPGKIMGNASIAPILKKFAPAAFEVITKEDHAPGFSIKLKNAELDYRWETLIKDEYAQPLTDIIARYFKFI